MRTTRKPSLLVAVFLVLTSSLAFTQHSAKGKAAETATTALLQMHSSFQQANATQKQQLLTQFTAMAAQRQQLLSSLIQTNPEDVLRVAIPNNVSHTMPPTVKKYVEQSVTAQGVLEALYEMQGTPDKTTGAVLHHFLRTSTGRWGLHFAASAPTHLLTGSVVKIHGVQVGSDVALESGKNSTSLQTVAAASAPTTSGAVNTLVIMVNFKDNPGAQPWTAAAVQNMVFTQTSNWDLENSFQHTWLTGDVAGWFTVPVASTTCDTGTIKSAALSSAQSAGYNLSSYSHYIYLMSSNTGCSSWWGLATVGGGDVWINGQYNIAVHVFAHEMGHNFGLYHAHTVDCGTQVMCGSGNFSDYGDGFDTMGASTYSAPHYNSFHKERLGWLNNGAQPPITPVTSSGTYQLSPLEAQDSNPKALKILQSGTTNTYYYVELRQAQGFDSFLSNYSDVMGGVVFHSASPSNANSSDLLDLTPSSPASFSHPALAAGQSYTDATTGITIMPVSVSSTGASVQVTLGTGTCTLANPTINVSPAQSQWVLAGSPVNFAVTVKDNDSPACAQSTFNLSDNLPSRWNGVWNTTALTLSPGQSGQATLSVTSPTGTADGFYNVGIAATNASSPSYTSSLTATYVISTPVPSTVAVSTNQPNYTGGQTVAIAVSVTSGGNAVSGAAVSVQVTKPNGSSSNLSGTTGTNGIASLTYRLQRKATKGTYQAAASANNASASTTFVVQ
jgi:NPCBM-associated, NEW3 domain of alpha-galactosidase